jgi:hypothetical protein
MTRLASAAGWPGCVCLAKAKQRLTPNCSLFKFSRGTKMSATINGIRKRGSLGWVTGLLALCGLSMMAAPAFCQNATAQTSTDTAAQSTTDQTATDQTAQSGDQTAQTGALQEVVVTAERRAQDVQTTPISIVAVSGDQLQSQPIRQHSRYWLFTRGWRRPEWYRHGP